MNRHINMAHAAPENRMNRSSARMLSSTAIAIAIALGGCAQEQGRTQAHFDTAKAAEMAEIARKPAPFRDVSTVRSIPDGVYIGATARQKSTERQLPSKWQGKQVSFVEGKPLDFRGVLYLVSTTTGMPVSYSAAVQRTATAVAGSDRQGGSSDSAAARQPRLAQGGPIPPGFDIAASEALVAGSAVSAAPASDPTPPGRMKVNYNGSLAGFLDSIAANFGVSWIAEGERIIFSSQQTKVFDIPALPVVLKLSTQFSSQGASVQGGPGGNSGGQNSGSSNDSVSTTTAVELWKDINSSLKAIVAGNGSIEISGATGTITVNAPPDTMAQVSNYVREINRRLAKEIVMNITVYSVNLSRSDRYSANINTILQNSKYGVGISSVGSVAQTLANGRYAGIPGQQGIGFSVLDGKFAGSNAVLEALSTAGEVSVVNSQSVTTMNGIPVPFRDVNTRGYAAQVSTTQPTGSVNSTPTTTITPGQVQTGYSMRMTPRVNNDGTILLEYALDLSELNGPQDGFRTFTTGGQTIQLPDVNSRNTVNQATIPAGSTLVLSGLERTRVDAGRSGTGSPSNFLLGGSRTGQVTRELLVVAITPEIIDLGHGRSSR